MDLQFVIYLLIQLLIFHILAILFIIQTHWLDVLYNGEQGRQSPLLIKQIIWWKEVIRKIITNYDRC